MFSGDLETFLRPLVLCVRAYVETRNKKHRNLAMKEKKKCSFDGTIILYNLVDV